MNNKISYKLGFTLIELLVVVLIIGILTSIALPQYQKAVEKARAAEGITMMRNIANANQRFFLANGRYAGHGELDLLDIEIPGSDFQVLGTTRIQTNYFVYSAAASDAITAIAFAQRLPFKKAYYLYILSSNPRRLRCYAYSTATAAQKSLCNRIDETGGL